MTHDPEISHETPSECRMDNACRVYEMRAGLLAGSVGRRTSADAGPTGTAPATRATARNTLEKRNDRPMRTPWLDQARVPFLG
jgi:hypothetical protein